jgi:hypothetical protein
MAILPSKNQPGFAEFAKVLPRIARRPLQDSVFGLHNRCIAASLPVLRMVDSGQTGHLPEKSGPKASRHPGGPAVGRGVYAASTTEPNGASK